MNEAGAVKTDRAQSAKAVFVSYSSNNQKKALQLCTSLEQRGIPCWISCRDVAPGENYQDAIVRALRGARSVVLVFSKSANSSDEIKKELSLASRYRLPVIALRIENVEPSDAFAYELSTRQWIDAFKGWDKSVDMLVSRIEQAPVAGSAGPPPHRDRPSLRSPAAIALAGLLVLAMLAGAWWWLRPTPAAAHSMTVRLAGFRALSSDIPAATRDAIGSEIEAAFNADGIVGISTASAPPPGKAPAYALGGTVHRLGKTIRVITRLTNERSGAILWSNSVDYAAAQIAKMPQKIAADAGTVVRCGLSGASTYRKSLTDAQLGTYMQYCQESWAYGGSKTLLFAQRVVAAVPDFSWGWSALQTGYMQASYDEPDSRRAEQLRVAGLKAAERALALDPRNSEALDRITYLIDPRDWSRQESLYKRSIAAKPLDCGCEHYGYGLMLERVGRLRDAVAEQSAATNMLALWPDSQRALADVLLATGEVDEAKSHIQTAIDLSKDDSLGGRIAVTQATETGDYAAALAALRDPNLKVTEGTRGPLIAGFEALRSRDAQAKARAITALRVISKDNQDDRIALLLAALGSSQDALAAASQSPWLFWRRSMRAVLYEPDFPAVANRLGLMTYWKTSRTRPDICSDKAAPPFCRMI